MKTKALLFLALLVVDTVAVAAPAPISERDAEYAETKRVLAEMTHWDMSRLVNEVVTPETLPQTGEWPSALVLRRARALAADLAKSGVDIAAVKQRLDEFAALQPPASDAEDRARFDELVALRRSLAFKNPLLNFDKILFLKHDRIVRGEHHMCDQYYGFNQAKGGGVFILENPFGATPKVTPFLKEPVKSGRLAGKSLGAEGAFVGLALDYDTSRVAFAYTEAEWAMPKATDDWTNQPAESYALSRKQQTHAFHYYWKPESAFHLFTANADGTGVRQITDGKWNDTHPTFLPNGRIVFTSDRRATQVRCGGRGCTNFTLHATMSDGSDVQPISFHETAEWLPAVSNDGRLIYTRWDYVDRDADVAHHPWISQPDGRNPLAFQGNYPTAREARPLAEMSIRPIPGSSRYMAVATAHHGQAYGSIILIDPQIPDDGAMGQLKRVTPEYAFPESEIVPGVMHRMARVQRMKQRTSELESFGTPWPLSEKYFLVVHSRNAPPQRAAGTQTSSAKPVVPTEPYGIYLCDVFGNRELLYRDNALGCLDPIPFAPRVRPPVLPNQSKQMAADRDPGEARPTSGQIAIMDIRESERPWPANTNIRSIRVVAVHPKPNYKEDDPRIGVAAESLVRSVLGTAPVESDGSAYFTVPAGEEIYFQALDENGVAVQTMRSGTYVHPGEKMTCIGCHEQRQSTPTARRAAGAPLALRRAPSPLLPEVATGAAPIEFAKLVQPVLDKHCVSCHDQKAADFAAKKPGAKNPPRLRGDVFGRHGWSESYHALTAGHAKPESLAWGMCGGNDIMIRHKELQYSVPGQIGARASRLYSMLKAGHGTKKMTPEELRRFTLWLDCNSVYYGSYKTR
ncbi:MAG: hypothetical protein LBV54_05220 [Puniceicoccales bacterium]|jgi:hypothetical protein|nr:hypothetical protein [Puniceicoccales bacterium]